MTRRNLILAVAGLAVVVLIVLWRRSGGPTEAEIVTDVAVHVAPLERATVRRYVTAYGYVQPEPAHDGRPTAGAELSPFASGVLAEIDAVEGRRVAAGTVLFRLDSRMAKVAVERAQQEVDFADQAFQRQQALLPGDGTSQRVFQEAKQRLDDARSNLATARTQLAYLEITAPVSGTIGQVRARVGQAVDANTVLATIVDLSRLVVAADVPAGEIEGLSVGNPVLIGADSAAPRGQLIILGKDVDPSTGTARVYVSVPSNARLAPGQFTDLRIVAAEHRDVLVVPDVALVTQAGTGSWVMVVRGDSATRTMVTVGIRDGGRVEIAGPGLEPGTSIVTDEAYSLPEETKIHLVER
jgi:membrane fusion protein, multidrug efflux system